MSPWGDWHNLPHGDMLEKSKRDARRSGIYCTNCEQVVEVRDGRCSLCNQEISSDDRPKNKILV